MATLRRIKLKGLNAHITCTLCQGYYVEATTIIECLHTFCRTCIVRYLETSTFCPVCEVQVHKTKPLLSLREDKTLQDVVYKLVPNLYRSEMQCRTEFYRQHPEAGGDRTEQSLKEKRYFFHVDDQISLSLEFLPPAHAHAHALGLRPLRGPTLIDQKETSEKEGISDAEIETKVPHKRFIKCQAAVQIRLLEKFIRLKYALSDAHRVDIVHGSDCLSPELTLLDVVYTYKYTEDFPLNLQYTVIAPPPTLKRKITKPTNKGIICNNEHISERKNKKIKIEDKIDTSQTKLIIGKVEVSEPTLCEVTQLKNEDNCDIAMIIDDDVIIENDNSDVKSNNNSMKSKCDSETLLASDFKKNDVNSSIESLRNFVNNAPGLSGYHAHSPTNISIVSDEKDDQSETTKTKINSNEETISSDISQAPVVSTLKSIESQSSLIVSNGGVPIFTPPNSSSTHATSVINCSVRPPILPNQTAQSQNPIRQPHISSPRVMLHRPTNIGFPQSNNLVRYNNVLSTRPVDPTKPRLGRPPNAARVAAAAAGRAIPQPILPRNPAARIQFPQNKHIIPNKIENRGRPKKKPLLMPINNPVINKFPTSTVLQPTNELKSCTTLNAAIAMNTKTNSSKDTCISAISTPSSSSSIATKTNNNVMTKISDSEKTTVTEPPKNSSTIAPRPLSVTSKINKSIGSKPSGSASRISSITDILVSKQLSQLNTSKSTSDNCTTLPGPMSLPTVPTSVNVPPPILPQICPGLPFLPAVNPALCAYMSEYNNVSNWLKLTQTAAVFRDMNMQALANKHNSPPNKSDITPMDLSPTNKNNINGDDTSQSSVNFLKTSVANVSSTSKNSTTDILVNPIRKRKVFEKEKNNHDKLIGSKFNNNNTISLPDNLHSNFNRSSVNFVNKVDSALNNSLTKCTSNSKPKISMNQVPLKVNATVPRKNSFTTLLKPKHCDKISCNGASGTINGAANSMKAINGKLSGDRIGTPQRSSPIPAVVPSSRSHTEGLQSVPSPKAAQSASPNSPSIPSTTISPPTPEVTITKLSNSSVSSSVSYTIPAMSNQISSVGKMTHTNTVSITKRSNTSIASVANKLAVRSPNASVRQIPNPSLLSQKPEVRNSKNLRVDN